MKFNNKQEANKYLQKTELTKDATIKLVGILSNFDKKVNINEVRTLIKEGVDLNAFIAAKLQGFNEYNAHPLMFYVIMQGNLELFKLFIDNGAKINSWLVYRDSSLHSIIKISALFQVKNTSEMFKELLKHSQVDINEAADGINTPLLTAINYMQIQFLELLLQQPGINLKSSNFESDYPLDIVDKYLHKIIESPKNNNQVSAIGLSIRKLLEEHGATFSPKYAAILNNQNDVIPTKTENNFDNYVVELKALGLNFVPEYDQNQ